MHVHFLPPLPLAHSLFLPPPLSLSLSLSHFILIVSTYECVPCTAFWGWGTCLFPCICHYFHCLIWSHQSDVFLHCPVKKSELLDRVHSMLLIIRSVSYSHTHTRTHARTHARTHTKLLEIQSVFIFIILVFLVFFCVCVCVFLAFIEDTKLDFFFFSFFFFFFFSSSSLFQFYCKLITKAQWCIIV